MTAIVAADYLARVRTRLEADGYEVGEDHGFALWAHRRTFRPSRFGFEDASVAIATLTPGAGAEDFERLADRAFEAAIETKLKLPRGLASSVLVYPVALIDRASSAVAEAARARRKHWAAEEYRVLFELERRGLTGNDERQLWGGAYFKGIRETALRYFAP